MEREYTDKEGLHGKGTTWRGEKGHTRKVDIYGEETTRKRARVYINRKREQRGMGRGDIHEDGEKTTWRREGTHTERIHQKMRI